MVDGFIKIATTRELWPYAVVVIGQNHQSCFVEVTEQLAAPAADAGVIELDVGGVVRVRGRVEAEALARVLDVLEARR